MQHLTLNAKVADEPLADSSALFKDIGNMEIVFTANVGTEGAAKKNTFGADLTALKELLVTQRVLHKST
jgi:hypothetical protein